ncbi:MAG TPA: hypothetical protein VJB57_05385 [Dehalococcoidia bacterium]|nr:hypothetical protein [Dehalococcoidia bacterium]
MKLVEKFTRLVETSERREPIWFLNNITSDERESLMQLDELKTPIWITVALADHFDEKPDNVLHWKVDPLLPIRPELLSEIRDFLSVGHELNAQYADLEEVWALANKVSFRDGPNGKSSSTRNRTFWKNLFDANMP